MAVLIVYHVSTCCGSAWTCLEKDIMFRLHYFQPNQGFDEKSTKFV